MAVAEKLTPMLRAQTVILANGATTSQKGFLFEAIPMYNLPESAESAHTKGRGNGYIASRDGKRVYVAGDTADIPEMRALKDIDTAFIPMNLPYTMTVESAAEGVLAFAPQHVYPYHYRGKDGLADVAKFKQLVQAANPAIDVVLEDWYPSKQ
jgi:L-ascorbate metabolism protein UlaG (beta-lactamase superfamily)